jgi:hypothetical protein
MCASVASAAASWVTWKFMGDIFMSVLSIMVRAGAPFWLRRSYNSMCRLHHGLMPFCSSWLVSARCASHLSVPCRDVCWGYFRQALCNMHDVYEHVWCFLLGTIILPTARQCLRELTCAIGSLVTPVFFRPCQRPLICQLDFGGSSLDESTY